MQIAQASNRVYLLDGDVRLYGVLAEFASPAALYHAAEQVRDAGYNKWDTFSPFPIHGMEDAMGVKRTILPVLVACGGFTGAGLGFLMQSWMSSVDYKMVTAGQPYLAWQSFVPITFELGILLSAFTCIIGMLALNGLPRWNHPLFKKERFLGSSDDKYFICIEAADANFHPEKTRALLEKAGATSIELVEE
jgi:hypothetical protein